jgi:sugar phosphate isomerase/epimerase
MSGQACWRALASPIGAFLTPCPRGFFTVPDDGSIEFAAVFIALKAADYRGWFVVEAEQDPADARPWSMLAGAL